MKRILLIALMVAVGLWISGVAMAGDYHQGTQLVCNDCHTMHLSQSHGYDGTGSAVTFTGGPYNNLLRDSADNLCLSCHNGQTTAPDVLETDANSSVRQAGALNLTTSTGNYVPGDGHTLGSTTTPPGGSWTNPGLACVNCHGAHGTTNYRNLLLQPGTASGDLAVGYVANASTNNTSQDVWQKYAAPTGPGNFNAARYQASNIVFNKPASAESRYGAWCGGCHGTFHTDGSGTNYRHKTRDATLDATMEARYEGLTNKVQTLNTDGGAYNTTGYTPSCMSCHKAHGNQNGFGLIYMSGSGTPSEQGDGGAFRDLCRQCHTQGG